MSCADPWDRSLEDLRTRLRVPGDPLGDLLESKECDRFDLSLGDWWRLGDRFDLLSLGDGWRLGDWWRC